jgi:hypothetical protein
MNLLIVMIYGLIHVRYGNLLGYNLKGSFNTASDRGREPLPHRTECSSQLWLN